MQELIELHAMGLNDSEMGEILNLSSKKIWYERSKLGLKSNFNYANTRTVDYSMVEELIKLGFNDREIAEKLNTTKDSIYAIRKKCNFYRKNFRMDQSVNITNRQLEILTGTLLGDSSLKLAKGSRNPSFSCEHGHKQSEYCYNKFKEFESLGAKFFEFKRKTIDERTGIYYKSAVIRIGSKTNFLELYNNLYINKTKRIIGEFLKNFTELSLAYLFMDDGSKTPGGYTIALMSFPIDDLELFRSFCEKNFGFSFTIYENGSIYIPSVFRHKFTELILPNMHHSMMYKVHI